MHELVSEKLQHNLKRIWCVGVKPQVHEDPVLAFRSVQVAQKNNGAKCNQGPGNEGNLLRLNVVFNRHGREKLEQPGFPADLLVQIGQCTFQQRRMHHLLDFVVIKPDAIAGWAAINLYPVIGEQLVMLHRHPTSPALPVASAQALSKVDLVTIVIHMIVFRRNCIIQGPVLKPEAVTATAVSNTGISASDEPKSGCATGGAL